MDNTTKKKGTSTHKVSKDKLIEEQEKAAQIAASEGFELVRLRNNFYRDSYRKLIVLLILMSAIIALLCATLYYMYTHRPAPRYFATNIQGQLLELVPLESKTTITDGELLNWAVRGITTAFTLNYVEWREQLQYVQDTYFTVGGSETYLSALKEAQTLQTIQLNKLVATAEATAAPVITDRASGNTKEPYWWKVSLPILMTLQNPNNILKVNMNIEMIIKRSSIFIDNKAVNIDGVRGIRIDRFLASKK